jgi:hypothetical protein
LNSNFFYTYTEPLRSQCFSAPLSRTVGSFHEIVVLLELSPDEGVRAVANGFEQLKQIALSLLPALVPYVTRWSPSQFLDFLNMTIESVVSATSVSSVEICTGWPRALIALVDFIDGRQFMDTIFTVRFLSSIAGLADDGRRCELLQRFTHDRDLSAVKSELPPDLRDAVWPSPAAGRAVTSEDFNNPDGNKAAVALATVAALDSESAIPRSPGSPTHGLSAFSLCSPNARRTPPKNSPSWTSSGGHQIT